MNEMITFDTELQTVSKVIYDPYELVSESDPILKQKAKPFDFTSQLQAEEISGKLKATLKSNKAYGVAAPQCGLPYRVFVIGANDEYITMFNPEIVEVSEKTLVLEEGCLSFPFLVISVVRPQAAIFKYQDEKGDAQRLTLDGLSARIALHEYDHLEGVTFNERAKPLALKLSLKKREKNMKKFARHIAQQRIIANEKPR